MGRWQMETVPEWPGQPLTGKYSDDDARQRLYILTSQLLKAEAAVAEAQQRFDADIARCRRQGQHGIAENGLKDLADRREQAAAAAG